MGSCAFCEKLDCNNDISKVGSLLPSQMIAPFIFESDCTLYSATPATRKRQIVIKYRKLCGQKMMVAKRFELLHLTIPECSTVVSVEIIYLESGALDRSAKQPVIIWRQKYHYMYCTTYHRQAVLDWLISSGKLVITSRKCKALQKGLADKQLQRSALELSYNRPPFCLHLVLIEQRLFGFAKLSATLSFKRIMSVVLLLTHIGPLLSSFMKESQLGN
ncbi:hypothetical protein ACU8KH_01577 [Lachancea thermotolerans]